MITFLLAFMHYSPKPQLFLILTILLSYLILFIYLRPRKHWIFIVLNVLIELSLIGIFLCILIVSFLSSGQVETSKLLGNVIVYCCFFALGLSILLILINIIIAFGGMFWNIFVTKKTEIILPDSVKVTNYVK